MRTFAILVLTTFSLILHSQELQTEGLKSDQLTELADKYAKASFEEFKAILSIPNDAYFPADIEKNVQWCEAAFQKRDFTTTRLKTSGAPLLLAERKVDNPQKTVLVYLQIDGQPTDSTKWFQETAFTPTLKQSDGEGNWETIDWNRIHNSFDPEFRIFARSTSDAKGPVVMFLAAMDAINSLEIDPSYDLKIIMDFEEEQGSPNLPPAVTVHKEALASDMLIIFDGPLHISNKPTLKFGARGISDVTLTVFGPRAPQHSGHYGNYAPNPAFRLAQLLASMKANDGRVSIPGFYDGVSFDDATLKILYDVPDDEFMIQKKIGIAQTDRVGNNYQEAIQYPSLNIRGMASAWVGKKKRTIVPSTATVEIDIRLVKESDPDYLIGLVRQHIIDQGYRIIEGDEPTEEERMTYSRLIKMDASTSYLAYRTPIDSPVGIWLSSAIERAFNEPPIKIRTSGGSIPIAPFVSTLGIPAVSVPTVNMDNNQHSPNENIRLGNYVDGVKTMIAILTEKFKD
jgi:acetylornithine deacetylase/succinyl-diaminopimelate desuccinylase-like protein